MYGEAYIDLVKIRIINYSKIFSRYFFSLYRKSREKRLNNFQFAEWYFIVFIREDNCVIDLIFEPPWQLCVCVTSNLLMREKIPFCLSDSNISVSRDTTLHWNYSNIEKYWNRKVWKDPFWQQKKKIEKELSGCRGNHEVPQLYRAPGSSGLDLWSSWSRLTVHSSPTGRLHGEFSMKRTFS